MQAGPIGERRSEEWSGAGAMRRLCRRGSTCESTAGGRRAEPFRAEGPVAPEGFSAPSKQETLRP